MGKITLFLDHDGVLSTVKQFDLTPQAKSWIHGDFFDGNGVYPFDKKCVKVLNSILEEVECDIVVSSDWKHYCTLEQMGEIYERNGVIQKPVAFTDHAPASANWIEKNRVGEIGKYIQDNNIEKYFVIDDLDLHGWMTWDNFSICASMFEGIKQSGKKEEIIKKLKMLL